MDDTQPTSTYKRVFRRFLLVIGFILLAIAAVRMSDTLVRMNQDSRTSADTETHLLLAEPYIHLGDHVPVKVVQVGQRFFVHNKYVKTDTCSVQVSNVFWGVEKPFVDHYSKFVNWFKAGTYEADEYFVAPNLPPQHYRLIKKSISNCNGIEHYSVNFDVTLEIEAAHK